VSPNVVLISSKGARSSHDILISTKGTPDARKLSLILKPPFCASAEGWKSEHHVSSLIFKERFCHQPKAGNQNNISPH
jgi:hypothetical protein